MAELRAFDDRPSMARAAAAAVADRLRAALQQRGAASLSLSGGSTPGETYQVLSGADLDWAKVTVTLSDERWLPPSSEHSNENLARAALLQGRAQAAHFIGLYESGPASAALIERRLAAVPRPVDVGILGLGEDGHTASLFPGTEEGPLSMAACGRVAVVPREGPGESKARITMTLPELAAHRALIVLAFGLTKRAIIDAVLGMSGDPQGLPIASVVAAHGGDIEFHWAP